MASQESHESSTNVDTKIQTTPFPPRMIQSKLRLVHIGDEIFVGNFYNFEDNIEKIKSLEIRSDDVLLFTFPRSGTHWTFRILDMLRLGKAEYRDFHIDQSQIEFHPPEVLDTFPSPRVLHSHLSWKFQPQQILEKKPKIIHMYRNPKAVAVSVYQSIKYQEPFQAIATMEAVVDIVKKTWPIFIDGINEILKIYPEQQIFLSSYEDMIANPQQAVKNLATFLGIAASDDLCGQIKDACSFDKQKSAEDKMNDQANLKIPQFRQGEVNNWKKHMTVAQSEEIDDMLRQRKDVCRFSAKYI